MIKKTRTQCCSYFAQTISFPTNEFQLKQFTNLIIKSVLFFEIRKTFQSLDTFWQKTTEGFRPWSMSSIRILDRSWNHVLGVWALVGRRSRTPRTNTLHFFSTTSGLRLLFRAKTFSAKMIHTYLWWWWYFKCNSSSIRMWNIFVLHFELKQNWNTTAACYAVLLKRQNSVTAIYTIHSDAFAQTCVCLILNNESYMIAAYLKRAMAIIINAFVIRGQIAERHIFSFHFVVPSNE